MKRYRFFLSTTLLLALVLLSACDSVSNNGQDFEEIVLPAVEETYVSSRLPDENFDGPYIMQVFNYGINDRMHGYARFDLSSVPASATVIEARVELFYFGCEGIDDIAVYPAAGPWQASALTWDNQPGPTGSSSLDVVNLNPGSTAPADCGDVNKYVAAPGGGLASKPGWYVTSLAQAWLQGSSNHGLVFSAPKSGIQAAFGVSEGADPFPANPPRLVLKYQR